MVSGLLSKMAASARRRSRASERGTAVFIVILVLMVLTSIGVFASRAAGLSQRTAGYHRQATQTGYVADYATVVAIDEMTPTTSQAYLQEMMKGKEYCTGNQQVDAGGGEAGVPCFRFTLDGLQTLLTNSGSSATFFEGDGGSLGPADKPLSPHFVVELTDPGPSGRPIAGSDQGGTGPSFGYVQLTFTGIGSIQPRSVGQADAGSCTTPDELASIQAAGMKTTRAIVQVGPVPK